MEFWNTFYLTKIKKRENFHDIRWAIELNLIFKILSADGPLHSAIEHLAHLHGDQFYARIGSATTAILARLILCTDVSIEPKFFQTIEKWKNNLHCAAVLRMQAV